MFNIGLGAGGPLQTIWGIDPSTNTGVIILDSKGGLVAEKQLQHGNRENPTKEQRAAKQQGRLRHPIDRCNHFGTELEALRLEYGLPHLVVIEDFGFAMRQSIDTIITQCWVGYVIRATLRAWGVPYIEIPPTTGKAFCGAAKKEAVMMQVLKTWGHTSKTNDQADAYVMARIGLAALGFATTTKEQSKALAKLKDDEVITTHVPAGLLRGLFN